MEHESNEQDFSVEQNSRESSLQRKDMHASSSFPSDDMSSQKFVKTDSSLFSDQRLIALYRPSWQERLKAVQALQGVRTPLVIEQLIVCLNDEEAVVRIAAIQVLGALGAQAPIKPLLATVYDPDWTVRETAVLTLGKLGVPDEELMSALYDEQRFVREAAIHVLKGRLPIDILIDDLEHNSNTTVRAGAARVLGELEEPAALRPLISAMQHNQQSTVRKAAILALGQLEIPIPIGPLKAALQTQLEAALHDEDQGVREAAALVLEAKDMYPIPDTDVELRAFIQVPGANKDMLTNGEGYKMSTRDRRKAPNYEKQQFGNYFLTEIIGEGGRATVYLGQHIYLKTQAAIKVLKMHLHEDELQGFLNEAQTIAKLIYPTIVRVLDFGVERGVPFLVMDYAPQGNLRQRYPRGVRVPLLTILSNVEQIAGALQFAHNNNVLHRDVKPENILLGSDNGLLLSDFGIAQLEHNPANPYQHRNDVSGTRSYMAPEQWEGKPCAASDQYSLAIIVYEWLCGTQPFRGSTLNEIMDEHLNESPLPLRRWVPDLSPQIEEVVLTALAKKPERRYSSVQAFADALAQAASPTSPPYLEQMNRLWLRFLERIRQR